MGDPRRLKKRYESPRKVLDADRIGSERKIRFEYGLKNTRELWKTTQALKNARREARRLLSKGAVGAEEGRRILAKLARLGIIKQDSKLDDVLTLGVRDFLGRRLQSVVLKRGLAKTAKQSRQLITHGFISVNGRKVSIPSFLVGAAEENSVSYYKGINLEIQPAKEASAPPHAAGEAEGSRIFSRAPEEKKQEGKEAGAAGGKEGA